MKIFLWFTISIFFISCQHDEFDAKFFARKYCNCVLKEKEKGSDFFNGRAKCDGELLVDNRFFRLDYIGFTYGSNSISLPSNLGDSVAKFHGIFYHYVESNCCKVALLGCDGKDSLQTSLRKIDTLFNR